MFVAVFLKRPSTNATVATYGDTAIISGVSVVNFTTNPLRVELSTDLNTQLLSLKTTAGLTFLTGTGTRDRRVSFTGSRLAVNAALLNFSYILVSVGRGGDRIKVG